jgi:hypothetical protein
MEGKEAECMSKVKQKRCYGLIPRKPRYWEK